MPHIWDQTCTLVHSFKKRKEKKDLLLKIKYKIDILQMFKMNEVKCYIMHSVSLKKEKPIFPNNLIAPPVYTVYTVH